MPLPAGAPRLPASARVAILGDGPSAPDRRGGNRVPVLREDWREPLRAQRDPLAWGSGRARSNRDTSRWRKQSWLGRFVSTYGWRAYALPVLVVLTAVVVYQTVTGTSASAPALGGP